MKRLIPLITFSLLCLFVKSQNLSFRGARSISLGSASSSLIDEWSYFNNPGAVGFNNNPSLGINYSNQFSISELQQKDASFILPFKVGVFSSGLSYSGFNAYSSIKTGFGYAIKLKEDFSIGVQFNYHQKRYLQLSNLKENLLTTEVGLLYKVLPNWNIGVSLNDFLGFFMNGENRSSIIRLGSDLALSDKVHLLLEGYQSVNYSFQVRAGLEYEPIKNMFFRTGVKTNPTEMIFGFGYRFSKFNLNIASAYHTTLGWSPSISLNYVFREKK